MQADDFGTRHSDQQHKTVAIPAQTGIHKAFSSEVDQFTLGKRDKK